MTPHVEQDPVKWFICSVLIQQKSACSIWELSEWIMRNEMAKIRRPRSNLILNIITCHSYLTPAHTLRLTPMTQRGHLYKESLQLTWSPFSAVNTPVFSPIAVLFIRYSWFLKCSLPKHLYWSFLPFFSFLAQINHPRSFPWARFLKHLYPNSVFLHLFSLFIFQHNSYLIYSFVIFEPVFLITVYDLWE